MHSSMIVQNVKVYTVSDLPFSHFSGIENVCSHIFYFLNENAIRGISSGINLFKRSTNCCLLIFFQYTYTI